MSAKPLVRVGEVVGETDVWNPAFLTADEPFSYIDISTVDSATKRICEVARVLPSQAPSRARQLVHAGDVLVSTVRPNLNAVSIVPDELDGAIASTGFSVLRPNKTHLEPRYLFHWVQTPQFIQYLTSRSTGASYPAVTERVVRDSLMPLPALGEQRKIVAMLDKVDAIRRKRKESFRLLDEFLRSTFLEMFGDPATNPKGWPRVPLGELLTSIDSGWSPRCLDRPVMGDEWGVLKLGAVTWCEYDSGENKALPAGVDPDPDLEVKPGDLLFARKNTHELVAACALVRDTPPRLLISDLIFRFCLRPDAGVDAAFLHQLLICPTKRRKIQKLAGGSAGSMPNISKERLRATPIELPPLSLQRDFALRVGAVAKLKTAHRASLAELDALFGALQHRAFALGEHGTPHEPQVVSSGLPTRT